MAKLCPSFFFFMQLSIGYFKWGSRIGEQDLRVFPGGNMDDGLPPAFSLGGVRQRVKFGEETGRLRFERVQ